VQGTTVEAWVQYGLGLPQYRDAFFNNGVTVLDFPLFLEDERLLERDLGVRNKLHRQQMLRAMRALVFGIGQPPAPVASARHAADPDGGIAVSWQLSSEVRVLAAACAGPGGAVAYAPGRAYAALHAAGSCSA
jgi:hypothetical protein